MVRLRAVLVCWLVAVAAPPAHAAIESDLVRQGIAAYNDLEYPRAVELLHKALQETLTREEKIVTFQTLAFAHVALGKHDDAVKDFENLLRIDGRFELDRTISPRVRAVFEEARGRVATQGPTAGAGGHELASLHPTVTPAKVKEGQAITVDAAYPGGVASSVELFYRTRGHDVFAKLKSPVDISGRFSVTVPGMHVDAPALEYYLVVLDENGASVALAGTLGQPLAVAVEGRKRPLYTKGWFWGVLGGVAVVGAGVATAVVLTTRSSISASTPATISIQPH
ncbi:MAG: Tetratricopeptide repeat protein [bacterium]|nr:Tetratricopeptide repeat protein [bacterium]